jgi:hypothetical protein
MTDNYKASLTIKSFILKRFLLIPSIFIFSGVEILLNTHFGTSLFEILGIKNILLYFYPTGQLDENDLFVVLLSLWAMFESLYFLIKKIFKINLKVSQVILNRSLHIVSFFTWTTIAILDEGFSIKVISIIAFLHLLSYGSVILYTNSVIVIGNRNTIKTRMGRTERKKSQE